MPYLTDKELRALVRREVRRAIKGNPEGTNQAAINELTSNDDSNDERQSGRHTGGRVERLKRGAHGNVSAGCRPVRPKRPQEVVQH